MDGNKESGTLDKQPAAKQRQLQGSSCLTSGAEEKAKTTQKDKAIISEKAKPGKGNPVCM